VLDRLQMQSRPDQRSRAALRKQPAPGARDRNTTRAQGKANQRLAKDGIELIGDRVSPHALRRLYASLRAARPDDPIYIAEQFGHTDPAFTFRVYQKAAKRRERLSGKYLDAFDRALEWAQIGVIAPAASPMAPLGDIPQDEETASPSHILTTGPRSSAG
jgi:integrase